ncbi:hypothetical protein Pfo_025362, partial [Paulownia fortunei]
RTLAARLIQEIAHLSLPTRPPKSCKNNPQYLILYKLPFLGIESEYSNINSIISKKKKKTTQFNFHKMTTKVNDASVAASAAFNKNLKRRRPIPQRGQIKIRIAAKAFQSLVSVVSAYSVHHLSSPRKKSQY